MRKLQPLLKLTEELENEGQDLSYVLVDREDLAIVDPTELEDEDDEEAETES